MVIRKPPAAGRTPASPPAAPKRKVAATAKASATPAVASKAPAAPTEAAKVKHKLVRDSFTIPKGEYAVLDGLKQRATRLTRPTKKGELIRAGIVALSAMADAAFLATLNAVPSLKTGRPKTPKAPVAKAAGKGI